jgi:hypothetical protein
MINLLFNLLSEQTKSKENQFWNFFKANIKSFEECKPPIKKEIKTELDKYCKGLDFGITMKFQNSKIENTVFITAHGDYTKFDTILNLVKTAPKFKDFKVEAFNPPSHIPDSIVLNDIKISTDEIYYKRITNQNGNYDLEIFLPIKLDSTSKNVQNVIGELLYKGIGELALSKIRTFTIDITQTKKNLGQRKLKEITSEYF